MSIVIAIPVFRVGCKVGVDRGRAWSVVEEALLWGLTSQSKTFAELSAEACLPHQLIAASIARLMRFRLVEVTLREGGIAFRASDYGLQTIVSGNALPFFPKRISKRVSFVIEWATGSFFPTRQVRIASISRLDQERRTGTEVRLISVEGGGPSISHEANLNRLSDIAASRWDEQIATIDAGTASLRDDEHMMLRVVDGQAQGLPSGASEALQKIIADAAELPPGTSLVPVNYTEPLKSYETQVVPRSCSFSSRDLIIGGSEQRAALLELLAQAHRRFIVHSTFLDAAKFSDLMDPIRTACQRGVKFDLLWGAEKDEETESRNAVDAIKIAGLVREDKDLQGRFTVHMRTTGSHAKLLLLDTEEDGWIAAAGSCNWLSSPFHSVELSVILRDPHVVADVAVALQRLGGRRGFADQLANEMALTARDLRRAPEGVGDAKVGMVIGELHDQAIRSASVTAGRRFVVGSNRLGSTARPGALLQGQTAAAKEGLSATVLYTQTTGPLKNRHARALAEEARANGVRLIRTRKIPLHGKFVAWDDDDLIVTSLNWASASADPDFPMADIGVSIHRAGVGAEAISRLETIFPELVAEDEPLPT